MTKPVDFKALMLPSSASVRKAVEVMTVSGTDIVLVVDDKERLKGIVVDSDIRKGILRGVALDRPVSRIMNRKPVTLPFGLGEDEVARFFRENPRANAPLVGRDGKVKGLAQMARYLAQPEVRPNWVVLLVGGQGQRLRPLTEKRPKPLLPVGGKPILETIVEQFAAAGFRNFVFAVNHHADQIREHFGDGARLGVRVRYIQEKTRLGTAGALSLLPGAYEHPLIVMNGDLLTKIDFRALLDFHTAEGHHATVCVREYAQQVPYGVIRMNGHRLLSIVEKPTQKYFVNAGIYVLEPRALKLVPKGRYYDMPQLLQRLARRRKGAVGCFPIQEYWIDIGHMQDYERAQTDYAELF